MGDGASSPYSFWQLWDAAAAAWKLRAHPDMLVCDALLVQSIFAGVGNIIKNEVLFRIRLHPLSTIGALPARKLRELVVILLLPSACSTFLPTNC